MISPVILSSLVELNFLLEELVGLIPLPDTARDSLLDVLDQAIKDVLDVELENVDDQEDEEDALDLVDALAELADRLIAAELLLPGVPGLILEKYDGPALEAAIRALVELFRKDPEMVALRKQKRLERRATRLERRRLRQLVRKDRREERRSLRQERKELRRSSR